MPLSKAPKPNCRWGHFSRWRLTVFTACSTSPSKVSGREQHLPSLPASNPHLLAPYKSSDKEFTGYICFYILSGTHLYLWNFLLERSSSQSSTGTSQKDETVGRYKSTGDIGNNDSLLRHNVCACRLLSCVCVSYVSEKKRKCGRQLSHGCKNKLPAAHGEIRVMEKLFFLTNGVRAKREYCCYVRNSTGSRSNSPAYRGEENIVPGFTIMMQFPYILLGVLYYCYRHHFCSFLKLSARSISPKPPQLAQHVGPREWGAKAKLIHDEIS